MSVSVSVQMNTSSNVINARQRGCGKVMFSQVSVCPQGGLSLVPCPFWGGVSLVLGSFWGWVCPEGGYSHIPPDMGRGYSPRNGIQWDAAVRILLECFLLVSINACVESEQSRCRSVEEYAPQKLNPQCFLFFQVTGFTSVSGSRLLSGKNSLFLPVAWKLWCTGVYNTQAMFQTVEFCERRLYAMLIFESKSLFLYYVQPKWLQLQICTFPHCPVFWYNSFNKSYLLQFFSKRSASSYKIK